MAAHSTVRALFDSYNGPLYQVIRGSDGTTTQISPLQAGGVANSGTQDTFCAHTTCLIQTIYDQSGHGNDLTVATAVSGSAYQGPAGASSPYSSSDLLTAPGGAPVLVGGKKAYGVFITTATGYRNNNAQGTATGTQSEGIYAVMDGQHYNNKCCFDYGNAERTDTDQDKGTMEALYFGSLQGSCPGAGSGPWLEADLENGLWGGSSTSCPSNPTINNRFITGILKGQGQTGFAIKGGNAQSGSLSTFYSGPRPSGYTMNLKGAIILGIGGDNSDNAEGTFYEGAMTSGYPTDDTETQVQANIVAAGYQTTPEGASTLSVGSSVAFKSDQGTFITHSGSNVNLASGPASGSSSFHVRAPNHAQAGSGCYSFESVDTSGSFIRHYAYQLEVSATDGSELFGEDSTFCVLSPGLAQGGTTTLRSWSYPARFWRYISDNTVWIGYNGGPFKEDSSTNFNTQASFTVTAGTG